MPKFCLSLVLFIMFAGMRTANSQPVTVEANGPDQMPLIYVHGFNDDGRLFPDFAGQYWNSLNLDTHQDRDDNDEEDYYVTQWASTTMDPFGSAEDGWAVFQTEDRIQNGPNYNSTDPFAYLSENIGDLTVVVDCPDFNVFDPSTWFDCESPALEFLEEVHARRIRNNYNRNGFVSEHSKNLRDRLVTEFGFGGKFDHTWQVNFITHSAGGLDTRALLHRLNQSDSQLERERIANTFYTAPPFGGSTIAELGRLSYETSPMSPGIFVNPWFLISIVDQDIAIEELIRAWLLNGRVTSEEEDLALDVASKLANVIAVGEGLRITGTAIATNPEKAALAALVIEGIKKVITDFVGIPGDPKMSVDLTPIGGVNHLNTYDENPHTKQFVIWGEKDDLARLNVMPPLAVAANDFSTIIDFNELVKVPGDIAVANVSAQILSDFGGQNGYMQAVGGFDLDHGGVLNETAETGRVWASHLLTAITSLELGGNVVAVDEESRYYLVSLSTPFSFSYETPLYTDEFGDDIQTAADMVQYRVAVYQQDGEPIHGDWTDPLPANTTGTFADIIGAARGTIGTGALFRLDWRSINPNGGRELFRFARFRIDAAPPDVAKVEFFDIQDPSKSEILELSPVQVASPLARTSLVDLQPIQQLPNLAALRAQGEPDVVIRSPQAKFLRIEFTEGGTVEYTINNPAFTNPVQQTLVNNAFSIELGSVLGPGLHSIYYRSRDAVGNTMEIQRLGILVDNQPPQVALNFSTNLPLDFVVGPDTPLFFEAVDIEGNGVSGSLTVPGLPGGTVDVNQNFRMGDTNLADIAEPGLTATFVTLAADVTDPVGNQTDEEFEILYDFTPPEVALQFVGSTDGATPAQELASGNFRTADDIVRVELAIRDNATGVVPPEFRVGQPGTEYQLAGGPFDQEQLGGRPLAWGGDVMLLDGLNIISFETADLAGNPTCYTFAIEKVDQLITFDAARPIEVLSRRDPAADDTVSNAGSVLDISVNDDASVFVFESGRVDLLPIEVTNEFDVYAWNNGSIILCSANEAGEPGNDRSTNPGVSGNGRYVYFSSEATNLTNDAVTTDSVNLYVKDITTGRIALINRDKDGNPANLPAAFAGTTAYQEMAATFSGRYLFFHDRFADYIDGDTNTNHDIYCVDLDPDVNGDYFDENYVIRRVSVGPGGAQGTGGLITTGGSLRPSCSADGNRLVYDTDHDFLYTNNTNDSVRDAIVCSFNGVDANGTIDFSVITNYPLNTYNEGDNIGNLTALEARQAYIDRGGTRAVFITAENISTLDTNDTTDDNDVYTSFEIGGNLTNRILVFSGLGVGGASEGRIANNHRPSLAVLPLGVSRTAYVANKPGLTNPGRTGTPINDLFILGLTGFERINWVLPDVQTTQAVLDGGVSPDGRWAWWVTTEEYDMTIGSGGGFDLFRRRLDDDAGGGSVGAPGGPRRSGVDRHEKRGAADMTSESGTQQTYEVVLDSEPHFEVMAGILSTDPSEAIPSVDTLTFDSTNWDTPQQFTVTGQGDSTFDGDQTYLIRVILQSKDSIFDNVLAREIELINTDVDAAPQVGVAATDIQVAETEGEAEVMVELSGSDTEQTVLVEFETIAGTALADDDYMPTTGTLTFAPGVRSRPIFVPLVSDGFNENNETFTLELSNPTNANLNGGTSTITIQDSPNKTVFTTY